MRIVNPTLIIENKELIQKLIDKGYGKIVECMLENEHSVYTKKGRLNKSSTCREMNWKSKQLEDVLLEMREVLKTEMAVEENEESL